MSLEAKIEALTVAVAALTQVMCQQPAAPVAVAPVVVQPAPTVASVVAPVVAAPVAAAMPPLPTFIPPVPPPVVETAAPRAPFTDAKGLVAYTMESYKNMGQQKGALIQNVLVECGTKNINELSPDKYTQFYLGVEDLKASA